MKKIIYPIGLFIGMVTGTVQAQNKICEGSNKVTIQLSDKGADAIIFSREDAKDKNYGGNKVLEAITWTWNDDGLGKGTTRSLLRFNLPTIPEGMVLESANIVLSAAPSFTDGHNSLTNSNASKLYKITTDWTEYGVTWNNQPSIESMASASLAQSTSPTQNYTLDVTTDVTGYYAKPATNFGWMLKMNTEQTYGGLFFHSKESATYDKAPKLVLKFKKTGSVTLKPGNTGIDANIFNRVDAKSINYGAATSLESMTWTWNEDGLGSGSVRSLLKFDLATLGSAVNVTSAKLKLFAFKSFENGHTNLTSSNASSLYRVTSAWDEKLVTWNNQPTVAPTVSAALAQSTTPLQNYTLDVTNDVSSMVGNPSTNYGWLIKMNTEQTYAGLFFHSSDSPTSESRPELIVDYLQTKELVVQLEDNGKDAIIFSREDAKPKNYGGNRTLEAITWTWDNDGLGEGSTRSLIEFNLGKIPKGVKIDSAKLTLNAAPSFRGGHDNSSNSNASSLIKINQNWAEYGVTWNNQPTLAVGTVVAVPKSTSPTQNYTLNVSADVKNMYSTGVNNGWMLKMNLEKTYAGLFFHSKESLTQDLAPKLDVYYSCIETSVLDQENLLVESIAFPNPTTGKIMFASEISSWEIYDLLGTLVMKGTGNTADLSQLNNGLYTLKSDKSIQKIIKQ
jgi:hypothetical protein